MRIVESESHKAVIIGHVSVMMAHIYPASARIDKVTPLLTISVPQRNPIAESVMARAVALMLDDLDAQVEKAKAGKVKVQ